MGAPSFLEIFARRLASDGGRGVPRGAGTSGRIPGQVASTLAGPARPRRDGGARQNAAPCNCNGTRKLSLLQSAGGSRRR